MTEIWIKALLRLGRTRGWQWVMAAFFEPLTDEEVRALADREYRAEHRRREGCR